MLRCGSSRSPGERLVNAFLERSVKKSEDEVVPPQFISEGVVAAEQPRYDESLKDDMAFSRELPDQIADFVLCF